METNLKSLFLLTPDVTYLNFGSFGACPKPIFDSYIKYQYELESEPVQFFTTIGPKYLNQSRVSLGAYIHCHADDVVMVPNPSHAVNLVARSLHLQPGDEILTTNLEYGACDKAWDFICTASGAKYVQQHISLPLTTKEEFVAEFFKGLTSKTKLVFISHITSSTALRLPVEEICTEAKKHGLLTFVDGAHAPGHVPLNMQQLQADFYTGACHKWMMTPKGCSFLYTHKESQHLLEPLIVSWGYKALFPSHSQFIDLHQFNGTRDFSAYLTIPDSIQFMADHNWEHVSNGCRQLVKNHASVLAELLQTQPLAPLTDDFILQMLSLELNTSEPEKFQRHLFEKYKIEIPVMRLGSKVYIRYSINAFNNAIDLEKLHAALTTEMASRNFIS
ncbi:MAG: aminotransferase class V-fold PLP-dependent enzyme [Bacteroidetes bacterium]|nr:aminotransferase class V-fold PLP-dependent enzyme [Bacteroidota bacterium]